MSEIIVVFDITDAPWRVLDFACRLAKKHSSDIRGIFLEEPTGNTAFTYLFPNDLSLTKEKRTDEEIDKENEELVKDNVKLFKEECERAGISCRVDTGFSLKQVEEETSGDLIIADVNAEFVKKLLRKNRIPVILVSGNDLPERIDMPKDADVEQFLSRFPEWRNVLLNH